MVDRGPSGLAHWRRPLLAVIGDGDALEGSAGYEAARALGRGAVGAGFRIVSGGRGGVMEAAFRGAHDSPVRREGDTLAIVPKLDAGCANRWSDIVIATGLGHLRNGLVANSDVVVAIGGGAGTLSEIAFAWMLGRPIIALLLPGWGGELAGRRLDGRVRFADIPDDVIHGAATAEAAVALAVELAPRYARARAAVS